MPDWVKHNPEIIVVLSLLAFAVYWSLIVRMVALASGWRKLARRFRAQQPFMGRKLKWQRAWMRLAGYNGCLTIGADPMGLFLSVTFIFSPGHPPLFIPWTEISVPQGPWLLNQLVQFQLGSTEQIRFKIRGRLASELQAGAGSNWPAAKGFGTPVSQPSATRFFSH